MKSYKNASLSYTDQYGWTSKHPSKVLRGLFSWDKTLSLRKLNRLTPKRKAENNVSYSQNWSFKTTLRLQEQTSSWAAAFITTWEAKTRESRPSQADVGGEGSDVNSLTQAARFPRRFLHMLVSLEWLCERQSESSGWAKRPVSLSLSTGRESVWRFINRLSFRASNHIYACLTKPVALLRSPPGFHRERDVARAVCSYDVQPIN